MDMWQMVEVLANKHMERVKAAIKIVPGLLSGLSATLCLLAVLLYAAPAMAVSAGWNLQDKRTGRERVTVRLEGAAQPESITRIGSQEIELLWAKSAVNTGAGQLLPAPEAAALFDGLVLSAEPGKQARSVILRLKDPAFGFIATRPDKDTLYIDIFKNPLGAKWTPPAAAASTPASSTAGSGASSPTSNSASSPTNSQISSQPNPSGSAQAGKVAGNQADVPANAAISTPGTEPVKNPASTQTGASSPVTKPGASQSSQTAQPAQSAQSGPTVPAAQVSPASQPGTTGANQGAAAEPQGLGSATSGATGATGAAGPAVPPASASQAGQVSPNSTSAQPAPQDTASQTQGAQPGATQNGASANASGTSSASGASGVSGATAPTTAQLSGASSSQMANGAGADSAVPTIPGEQVDFPSLPSGVLNPSAIQGQKKPGSATGGASGNAAGSASGNASGNAVDATAGSAKPGSTPATAGQAAGANAASAPASSGRSSVGLSEDTAAQNAGGANATAPNAAEQKGAASFSPGASYLQSGSSSPDAGGSILNNPAQGLEDDEPGESFPVWPPLNMPKTLPSPPPPVYGGDGGAGAFLREPASTVAPLAFIWPDSVSAASLSGQVERGNAYRPAVSAPSKTSVDISSKIYRIQQRAAFPVLHHFFAAPALAAEAPEQQTELIEAPFVYRSGLVKDAQRRPSPQEASQPVFVRVPVGSGTSGTSTSGTSASGTSAEQRPGQTAQSGQATQPSQSTQPVPAQQQGTAAGQTQATGQQGGASGQSPTGQSSAAQSASGQSQSGQTSGQTSGQATTQSAGQSPAQATGQSSAQSSAQGASSAQQGSPYPTQSTPPENVVFVDEQGNPVEAPLDPKVATFDLQRLMNTEENLAAFQLCDKILQQGNLTREQREFFLHRRADAFFTIHRDHPTDYFSEIVDYTTQAINFNTRSARNAGGYLRLGYLNLKANNAYEAEAYFTLLRQQFPRDDGIPLSYYYMGDYQYEQGNLNDAVLQFLRVVQDYPDSRYSRDAALGLTRTLYRLGYYDKAYEVIDYVEKRWPRYYLDYAPVLSMLGDTAYRARHVDRARQAYWLYYNLHPNAPDADVILSRLGDIYQSQKYRNAAVHVYEEAVRRFPDKDGGIIAMMRLAENGINDEPTLASMFKVFQQPFNLRPAEAYRKIIREYPDSPLVPLAKLKLAMWSVWQKDFESAFRLCNEIVMADPNHPLSARALEVSRNAFALLAAESVNSKRYERVRDAWDRYPMLHTQEEFLDPESRLALAVSQWEGSNPDGALSTIEPFFLGNKIPEYSEMALMLGLKILVDYDRWPAIEDLARRVEMWEITPETKNQLDYALGLAYESQGKGGSAMPIWKNLYEQNALPPEQQAYADYFLARQAESDGDLESAYRIGRDALQRLKDLAALNPEQADGEKIKSLLSSLMNISQASGLLQDALNYGNEFMEYTERGSDDYLSVVYGMAALHRRRGSMGEWEKLLQELSENYPHTYYGKAAASQLSGYRMSRNASQFSPTGTF